MRTHYYLGWFTDHFPEKLEKLLQEDIVERKSLVLVSAMPASDEGGGAMERSWLEHAGIRFEDTQLIDDRVQKSDAQTLIQNASVIFLLGGYTMEQNKLLMEMDLAGAIRKSEAVVIGASAGAINMSAKWICSKNFGYEVEESTVHEGIGLGEFSILSHYDLSDLPKIQSDLSPLSEELDTYASNKDCAVRVKGEQIDIIGDVYLISRSEIRKLDETIHL